MSGERCETCRFWKPNPDPYSGSDAPEDLLGLCRRGLRHVQATIPSDAEAPEEEASRPWSISWPGHYADDWCGEWAARDGGQVETVST